MVRSIGIAVALTFCLGLALAAAILVVNEIDSEDGGLINRPCRFAGNGSILTVYQAPISDATQERARVSGSDTYRVTAQRTQHVLIELRDQRTAWADRRDGSLQGQCDDVPTDNTPLGAFPTLCTLTTSITMPVYQNAALSVPLGTLPPGTYPLIGLNRDRVYIYLDTNQGGWVLSQVGQLQGNCVMLPARPG
jgi:hypothetical protein